MQQAQDFLDEVDNLAALIADRPEATYDLTTQFKDWTINDVIGHLHMFDVAAIKALESDQAFENFFAPIVARQKQGMTLLETQYPFLGDLRGQALVATWYETAQRLGKAFASADPKQRLRWAGPNMSAKSCITARQMETWAHGHEVFDCLGVTRKDADRIKNICHLGVATYSWTFLNRNMEVPDMTPYVTLTSPSGALWTWNDTSDVFVEGDAVEFAQVVTQVRNVEDTCLKISGKAAHLWMKFAQCFAGDANLPPAKGTRFKTT